MKKMIFTLLATVLTTSLSLASDYRMIRPQALKETIDRNATLHLVDIQVVEEFDTHSLPGAIATHAYPLKSESDLAKLQVIVSGLKQNGDPLVIVCPRGKGGAERTYRYL